MSVIIGLILGLTFVLAGEGSLAAWFCFGATVGLAILGQCAIRDLDRRAKWQGRD